MEVNEGATSLVYRIDDRTGPWIKVQKWVTDDQDPANQEERVVCQEGMYVKVIGHIKTFNKQTSVTAFHIKPIVDFNEVTHHLAEVMFIHLAHTRGVPVVSPLFIDRSSAYIHSHCIVKKLGSFQGVSMPADRPGV